MPPECPRSRTALSPPGDGPGAAPSRTSLIRNELPSGTRLAFTPRCKSSNHSGWEVSVRSRFVVLGILSALPMAGASQAGAQQVSADIRIGTGPVSGRVILGDDPYILRRRHDRDVYIVQPRVIVVERIRPRGNGWHRGWYKQFRRDARLVVIYYDRRSDRFYDRGRPGYRQIEVWERGGRFYRFDDDRDDRDYRRDGYDDRWEDRWDDRRDDRWDDRRDDRWDGRRDDRRDDRRNDRRDDRRQRDNDRDY